MSATKTTITLDVPACEYLKNIIDAQTTLAGCVEIIEAFAERLDCDALHAVSKLIESARDDIDSIEEVFIHAGREA